MSFQSRPYHILTEEEFSLQIGRIEEELSHHAQSGRMVSFDGTELAYEYFTHANPKGSIVIVHGFTEFYKKYYELAWYLLQEGYQVFLYDQRGHGLSQHLSEDPELVHLERFDDYARDLSLFIDQVVRPQSSQLPIDIYAHSMGGTVTLFYLSQYANPIRKAFLSAPMVTPYAAGIPRILIRIGARRFLRKLGPTAHFPYSGRFNPNADFAASSDASFARFSYYLKLRCDNLCYQTSGATNRWMDEVSRLQGRMLRRTFAEAITTPVCLVSCQEDRAVRVKQQLRLAAMLPDCRLVSVPKAAHSLYTSTGRQLTDFYELLFDFLQ